MNVRRAVRRRALRAGRSVLQSDSASSPPRKEGAATRKDVSLALLI